MTAESPEPAVEASPMGKSESVKRLEASQARGILAHTMDTALWKKEMEERP